MRVRVRHDAAKRQMETPEASFSATLVRARGTVGPVACSASCADLRLLAAEVKQRILMASQIRAEIDCEGRVKIAGMIDFDVTKLPKTDGTYRTDSQVT